MQQVYCQCNKCCIFCSVRDREDGEIAREAPKPTSSASSELSARQRARMADLSLLLDVILKSHGPAAKKEFCECGVLHQLQVSPLLHCVCSPASTITNVYAPLGQWRFPFSRGLRGFVMSGDRNMPTESQWS